MMVQLIKATIFGKPFRAGELVEVPNQTASRWVKNGIAVLAEEVYKEYEQETSKPTLINEEDLDNEEDLKSDSDVEEIIPYKDMSAKDLYKECIKKGLEAEVRQTREYYLELLAVKEG